MSPQLPTSYSWGTEDLQLVRQMLQQQVQLSITLASRNNADVELNGMNQTGHKKPLVGVSFTSAGCKTLIGFESPYWIYSGVKHEGAQWRD